MLSTTKMPAAKIDVNYSHIELRASYNSSLGALFPAEKKAAFTLVELMVVILIIGILAAIAIPLMQGRVDSSKWSEACATAGTIRVAVRTYASETSVATAQALVGTDLSNANTQALLGFDSQDCEGTYFVPGDYTITSVNANGIATITVTGGSKPDAPSGSYVLQANGRWVMQ